MDDVQIPQMAQTYGPGWHFFGRLQSQYFERARHSPRPQLTVRPARVVGAASRYASYVTRLRLPTNVQSVAGHAGLRTELRGTVLSVSGYGYSDSRITYTLVGGGSGVISTDDVDWSTTTQLNNQRGVRLTLHAGHPDRRARRDSNMLV